MGNIGDLHFDVILDDKSFKEKIESVKKKAEELNTSLSTALKIQMPKPDLTGLVEMSNSFKSVANSLKEIASVSKRAPLHPGALDESLARKGHGISED